MSTNTQPHIPSRLTFPSKTSTTSYWLANPHQLENHRSTPDLPTHSDILIIGTGMTGVSVAYNILHSEQAPNAPTQNGTSTNGPNGPHLNSTATPSITLLEARTLCSGATARNGGHLKLAFAHLLSSYPYPDTASLSRAIEIGEYQLAQLEALKEVSEREGLDREGEGQFLVTRSWDVVVDEGMWREKVGKLDAPREAVEGFEDRELRERGRRVLGQIQVLSAEKWGEEGIERITGVKNVKGGALGVPAASLWPYKFVCGLTERILDRINLQTNTVVRKMSEQRDADGYFTIETDRGAIKARKVVFATNAYTAGVLPAYEGIIMPVKGTACHTVRKQRDSVFNRTQARTFTYNIHKPSGEVDYLNHRPDGGVVMGGAYELFRHDAACCVATVDDGTLIQESKVRAYFENLMRSNYRDWEESDVEVDHLWTGIMGATPDNYPHVGPIHGKEGQYICAGFNGAGMLHIFLAARGLARMVRDAAVKIEDTEIPSIFRVSKDRRETGFPEGRWTKAKAKR